MQFVTHGPDIPDALLQAHEEGRINNAWSQKNLAVWKLSHGSLSNSERQQCLGDQVGVMGKGTGKEQGKKFAEAPDGALFFYGQETPERVAFHKSQAIGGSLTRIEDIVPIVRFLATEGWWITGQTLFANGGYTTR